MEQIEIYLAKAFISVFLLLGLSLVVHQLPVFVLASIFIIIALTNSAILMYLIVINKAIKEHRYKKNSWWSWLNHKKTIGFIISVIVPLVPAFLFVYEIQTWQWGIWVAVLVFILIFCILYKGIRYFIGTQYVERHKQKNTLKYAVFIPLVVALGFTLYEYFFVLPTSNRSILDAIYYYQHRILLNQSSSYLVSDISQIMSMLHAFSGYMVGRVVNLFQFFNFIWIFITYAAIFINITSICMFCIIPLQEFKRLFLPLYADSEYRGNERVQKKEIIVIALIYFAVFVLFLHIEHEYARQVAISHTSWLKEFEQNLYGRLRDMLDIII